MALALRLRSVQADVLSGAAKDQRIVGERNLSVRTLVEEIPLAFGEDLEARLTGDLREEPSAVARDNDQKVRQLIPAHVPLQYCCLQMDLLAGDRRLIRQAGRAHNLSS